MVIMGVSAIINRKMASYRRIFIRKRLPVGALGLYSVAPNPSALTSSSTLFHMEIVLQSSYSRLNHFPILCLNYITA